MTTPAPIDAATLIPPPHSHRPEHPVAQDCPACMRHGKINPDTGSLWPSLDGHGEQVIAETVDRFHDRYDGPGSEDTALTQALTEAYLRGRMRGRLAERADMQERADRYSQHAADLSAQIAVLHADDPGDPAIRRSLGLASTYADQAAALRHQMGGGR